MRFGCMCPGNVLKYGENKNLMDVFLSRQTKRIDTIRTKRNKNCRAITFVRFDAPRLPTKFRNRSKTLEIRRTTRMEFFWFVVR